MAAESESRIDPLSVSVREWKAYVVGALLLYVAWFIDSAPRVSSEFMERLLSGSLMALLPWTVMAPLQFLLQVLGRWLLLRFLGPDQARDMVVLNFPVGVFLLYAAGSALFTQPKKDQAFMDLVTNKVPFSVSITGFGYSHGVGGDNHVGIEFQIGEHDLDNLLRGGGYSYVAPEKDLDLATYMGLVKEHCHLNVKLRGPYSHYILRLKGHEKHIF